MLNNIYCSIMTYEELANIYGNQNKSLVSQKLRVGFLSGSVVNTTGNAGQGGFDPWAGKIPGEKEMATYFSILSWKIP